LGKGLACLTEFQKDDACALIHEFDETDGISDPPKRDLYLKVVVAITSEIATAALASHRKSPDMLVVVISNGLSQNESWKSGNCRKSGGF
jgi:hypothetical protein